MTPPPAAGATIHARPRVAAPPLRRPIAPRRVSGPSRAAPQTTSLGRLIDAPLLDRLIRGRLWIGAITVALLGIVALQVTLLKLNTGIGRDLVRASELSRQDALLGAQVSALESPDRVQAAALARGMVYAPAGDVRFVRTGPGDAARAARAMTLPSTGASLSGTTNTSAGGHSAGGASAAAGAGSSGSSGAAAGASSSGSPSAAVGAGSSGSPVAAARAGSSGSPGAAAAGSSGSPVSAIAASGRP